MRNSTELGVRTDYLMGQIGLTVHINKTCPVTDQALGR